MESEITPQFESDDRRAVGHIAQLKRDLEAAKDRSPSLVSMLKDEVKKCTTALESARKRALEFVTEDREASVADARSTAFRAAVGSSYEVDPAKVDELLTANARAQHIAFARLRRREVARNETTALYGRASKEDKARSSALNAAGHLVGMVLDREIGRTKLPDAPDVVAWMRVVLPREGRDEYITKAAKRDETLRSYERPSPSVEKYDAACAGYFAEIDALMRRARDQADKLAAVAP